jgi:polyhydroxyalkanoate synthesis regulator phasin
MADFNQSINNSFSNFGRPANDYMSNFGQSNTAFTNIYNTWLNTLNSSYDTMSKNMGTRFNKDVFSNFMQGSQVYAKMQEFFQPMANMMKNGQFNMESFKTQFTPEAYTNLTKQMFGGFYNESSIKDIYDNAIKQIHTFFTSQNNLGKEYFAQMQNVSKEFPNLFGNNTAASSMKDFYSQISNVFGKTFEPLLKLVNAGKEKENIEALIQLMDRVAEYSVKQAELQAFLQTTAKKSVEKVAAQFAEKFQDPKALTATPPSAQEMYNEWVKVNEQLFTELFASEEFSKVKGEAINLSNDVKKHFEKQFENTFANFPVVFKSEVADLEKTVYELKKQVKELQSKLGAQSNGSHHAEMADHSDDKAAKRKK